MRRTLNGPAIDYFSAGGAIANKFGVPGTLGAFCLARDDDRLVFLTSHHVLFGANAKEQDTVWVATANRNGMLQQAAHARYGRCGTVAHEGLDVFVDCAVAELDPPYVPRDCRIKSEWRETALAPGDRVRKTGAATGTTEGIVVATDHRDTARVGARRYLTPGQILVRPDVPGDVFSTRGDSGAVLRNADGAIVGLLWGVDARGFGLTCPIAPVLRLLHVSLIDFDTGVER